MRWWARAGETFRGLSILTKLLLSFFIIVSPLYAFNFYVNNVGAAKNRNEISASLLGTVHSYNKLLETEFVRIKQALDQSAVEVALQYVKSQQTGMTDVEKAGLILDIQRLLVNLQTTSRHIENTLAFLPALDDTLFSYGSSSGSIDRGAFESLQTIPTGGFFHSWNGSVYISAPYIFQPGSGTAGQDGLFVLAARMYDVSVKNLLQGMNGYAGGGATFYEPNQKWQMSTSASPAIETRLQRLFEERETLAAGGQVRSVEMAGQKYLVAYERSDVLNTVLAVYAREDVVFGSLRTYSIFFWIMSALSSLVIILFSLWLYKIIHQPLKTLVNGFRKVERGSLQFALQHPHKDEFGYMYEKFNDMVSRLHVLIQDGYVQQLRNQRSELKRLQSQINPHFLYNSFFVLSRLIHSGDAGKASTFAEYLGRYFQFITRDASDDIRLEHEIQHARAYTDIQTVCFDKRIAVAFEPLPEAYRDVAVPRLIVQPLLENAYKYAFEHMLRDGRLIVRFEEIREEGRPPCLMIVIEDNGSQLDDRQLGQLQLSLESFSTDVGESTGLYNIHKRIQLKFGAESGIRLSRSALGGLLAAIVLFPGE
ncbi:MAG: histidine kinase [Paenibacillaceae bacterium]|nr:histidine kinase [Paenibacillaceae bacterium]